MPFPLELVKNDFNISKGNYGNWGSDVDKDEQGTDLYSQPEFIRSASLGNTFLSLDITIFWGDQSNSNFR